MAPASRTRRAFFPLTLMALGGVALVGVFARSARGSEGGSSQREFSVTARDYAFNPARLDVSQDDLVKVSFHAGDMAHSFTIDSYRIAKRAAAGQTVIFEFRADHAGSFPIYCNLTTDEKCREMHGELVVRGR